MSSVFSWTVALRVARPDSPTPSLTHTLILRDTLLVGMTRMTYTVGPMPGESKRWRVQADGREVSKHNKKRNAVQKAQKLRDRNDTVTVMDKRGRFQKRI